MGIAHQTAASCRGKVLQSSCYMNQPQLMFSLFILCFLSFLVVEGSWDSGAVSPVPAYIAAGPWAERHVCGSGCCAEAPEGPFLGFSWALCCHGVVWSCSQSCSGSFFPFSDQMRGISHSPWGLSRDS